MELLKNIPDEQKNAVRWFIDCGDDDFLYEGNSLVHIEMRKKKIPHEFRIRDGGHNWTYWRESLPEVLWFVSDAFHQLIVNLFEMDCTTFAENCLAISKTIQSEEHSFEQFTEELQTIRW